MTIKLSNKHNYLTYNSVCISEQLNHFKKEGLQNIAITTNGVFLKRQVANLKKAGLDSVNISLDTLIKPKFELITRRKGWDLVMKGIDASLSAGLDPVKVLWTEICFKCSK